MAKVTVFCPQRAPHVGFHTTVGFFEPGTTERELSDDQVAELRGLIERGEAPLTLTILPPEALSGAESAEDGTAPGAAPVVVEPPPGLPR